MRRMLAVDRLNQPVLASLGSGTPLLLVNETPALQFSTRDPVFLDLAEDFQIFWMPDMPDRHAGAQVCANWVRFAVEQIGGDVPVLAQAAGILPAMVAASGQCRVSKLMLAFPPVLREAVPQVSIPSLVLVRGDRPASVRRGQALAQALGDAPVVVGHAGKDKEDAVAIERSPAWSARPAGMAAVALLDKLSYTLLSEAHLFFSGKSVYPPLYASRL